MAITIDDFSKIWASTSPLTPYEFSEDNYKRGWNFVGSTPPSRQMWDFIQKSNDEKSKYLLDNFADYLPLAGGTMAGAIVGNPLTLSADDGNDSADLVLNSNGSSTWNGKEIERVNASGEGYIRYESGLQICWGEETKSVTLTQINSTGIYYTNVTITLPLSFKDTNYVVSAISRYYTGHTLACGFTPDNTGAVSGQVYDFYARTGGNIRIWWNAIGWWK